MVRMSNEKGEEIYAVLVESHSGKNRVEYIPVDEKKAYPSEVIKIYKGDTSDELLTIRHDLEPYEFIRISDTKGEIDKRYKTDYGYDNSEMLLAYGKQISQFQVEQAKVNDELDYEADFRQNSKNLEKDLADVKNGTNEDKLRFVEKYGYLFDSNQMDESSVSKETYKELSSLVKDTFEANKDKFKDDRNLFIAGISMLEHVNLGCRDCDIELTSYNAKTLSDMFYHCDESKGCSLDFSLRTCNPINAEAARYVLNHWEGEDLRNMLLNQSPEYKKQTEDIARKKEQLRKRLASRTNDDKISGTVIADKIAEAQMSGVIYEPITPEKGNKMAENIRMKLSQRSR